MRTLIKKGRVVTAVDDYIAGIFGKGGLNGNVIRSGVMLNSTTDSIEKIIEALDSRLGAV
jgi:hypothetical protein